MIEYKEKLLLRTKLKYLSQQKLLVIRLSQTQHDPLFCSLDPLPKASQSPIESD